jgi:hypothetical protein
MEAVKSFTTKDKVIVVGENPNAERMVTLVAYIQPGDNIFYEDGYWAAGPEGAWIIEAEDLVRSIRFRGEVISYLAQVTPSEIRALGEGDEGYQAPKAKRGNVVELKPAANSRWLKRA